MPDSVITPDRLLPRAATAAPVLNALTIDVEDYYHVSAFEGCMHRADWPSMESRVCASTTKVLALLDAAGVRGTFFILGWVADRHPDLVSAIHAAGHEIACHGYWHRLVYSQTPAEFRADLCRCRDLLQDLTGTAVRAYRAPSFSITRRSLWALDILIEAGFTLDASIYPIVHDRYGIAGAPLAPHWVSRPNGLIAEFPSPVWRCLGWPVPVGGGGYFRLYPYALTRQGLSAINRAGRPATVYLHPWEFDPQQPRMPCGLLKRFRHYVGLGRTEARFAQLLRDFAFAPLGEVFTQVQESGAMTWWDPAT